MLLYPTFEIADYETMIMFTFISVALIRLQFNSARI